jgi:glutamate racemase
LLAEAKLHGKPVPLDELKRIRPWLRMEPPDTVVLGCTHFPLLQHELLQVLPEGRGWWIPVRLLRVVRPGCFMKRLMLNQQMRIAYCMAVTPETVLLLPVLQRYGFGTLEKLAL